MYWPNYEMYDFDTEESQENYRKELKVFGSIP